MEQSPTLQEIGQKCKRTCLPAGRYVEKHFGPQEHPACNALHSIAGRYEKLMGIYKKAIALHK